MTFCDASHLYSALVGAERVNIIELYAPGDYIYSKWARETWKPHKTSKNVTFFLTHSWNVRRELVHQAARRAKWLALLQNSRHVETVDKSEQRREECNDESSNKQSAIDRDACILFLSVAYWASHLWLSKGRESERRVWVSQRSETKTKTTEQQDTTPCRSTTTQTCARVCTTKRNV